MFLLILLATFKAEYTRFKFVSTIYVPELFLRPSGEEVRRQSSSTPPPLHASRKLLILQTLSEMVDKQRQNKDRRLRVWRKFADAAIPRTGPFREVVPFESWAALWRQETGFRCVWY